MSDYSTDELKRAEMIVLSGLLANPSRFAEVVGSSAMFSLPEVRVAILAAQEYRRKVRTADGDRYPPPDALAHHAEKLLSRKTGDKDKDRRNRGVLESFRRALVDAGSWPDPGEHEFLDRVEFVRRASTDLSIRRGMLDAVELLRKGADSDRIAESLAATAADARASRSTIIERELSSDVDAAVSEYRDAKNAPAGIYIPTPWPQLNKTVGGGVLGRLWAICAYAKQCKTITAANLVYHASIGQVGDKTAAEGLASLVISSEQGVRDIRNMMLVRHTHRFIPGGIDFRGLTAGRLSPEHERALVAAAADIKSSKAYGPIRYTQVPNRTTTRDISAIIAKHSRTRRVDVCTIDHTMLFAPASRQYDRTSELTALLQELHEIAISYDRGRGLWMLACHQIKREGYERALKTGFYEPFDAGGTSELERSCDVMVWTFFDQELDDAGEIRMGVALDRQGEGDRKGFQLAKATYSAALLNLE